MVSLELVAASWVENPFVYLGIPFALGALAVAALRRGRRYILVAPIAVALVVLFVNDAFVDHSGSDYTTTLGAVLLAIPLSAWFAGALVGWIVRVLDLRLRRAR